MGLNSIQILNLAKSICNLKKLQNKMIVLCEGAVEPEPPSDPNATHRQLRQSPGTYAKERFEDSRFYKKCLPVDLRSKVQFINCGDRSNVIDAFHRITKICQDDPVNSYIDIERLFAIVDLDLEVKKISNYNFPSVEDIYNDIYCCNSGKLRLKNHRIYTTGLIHKEAYFILPELEGEFFSGFLERFPKLQHSGQPFNLKIIYQTLINSIGDDPRIKEHFDIVKQRLQGYLSPEELIDLDPRKLQVILEQRFEACTNQHSLDSEEGRSLLIKAVLVITKVKDLAWNQITDGDDYPLDAKVIRDQLTLNIAEYFSQNHESLRDFLIMEILKFIAEQARS